MENPVRPKQLEGVSYLARSTASLSWSIGGKPDRERIEHRECQVAFVGVPGVGIVRAEISRLFELDGRLFIRVHVVSGRYLAVAETLTDEWCGLDDSLPFIRDAARAALAFAKRKTRRRRK